MKVVFFIVLFLNLNKGYCSDTTFLRNKLLVFKPKNKIDLNIKNFKPPPKQEMNYDGGISVYQNFLNYKQRIELWGYGFYSPFWGSEFGIGLNFNLRKRV